jgi:hypothetical protein
VKIPGHDKAVPAVVAAPGGNPDASRVVPVDRIQIKSGCSATGIFHEYAARNAKRFDGGPVHPLHFICRD